MKYDRMTDVTSMILRVGDLKKMTTIDNLRRDRKSFCQSDALNLIICMYIKNAYFMGTAPLAWAHFACDMVEFQFVAEFINFAIVCS